MWLWERNLVFVELVCQSDFSREIDIWSFGVHIGHHFKILIMAGNFRE